MESGRRLARLYAERARERMRAILLLSALLPLLFFANLSYGARGFNPASAIHGLMGSGVESVIVRDIRLPAALAAVLVGASLGLAGAVMQTILDNPLASPYTLGVSAGAAFGAAAAYAVGFSIVPGIGGYAVPVNAFAFAMATSLLVYALGRARGFTSEALVLAGIAVSYMFHSLLALMEYLANEEALQAIVFWLFGSLYKATWSKLLLGTAGLAASLVVLTPLAWRMTSLRLGDEAAEALGAEPRSTRLLGFAAASLLTALSVCFYGVIGFIGLIAPHVARGLVGEDFRYLASASALAGALVLSAAHLASRALVPGGVLPIGIVTSLAGVPFFLAIVAARRGAAWSQ